jgi:hypothetical protein
VSTDPDILAEAHLGLDLRWRDDNRGHDHADSDDPHSQHASLHPEPSPRLDIAPQAR